MRSRGRSQQGSSRRASRWALRRRGLWFLPALAVLVAACGPNINSASKSAPPPQSAGSAPAGSPTTSPSAPPTTAQPPSTTPTTAAPTPTTAPPSSSASGTVPGSRVGLALSYTPITDDPATVQRAFDLVASTGAKWVRFDFYWSAVQPARGSWNWAAIDRAVDLANAHGLSVVGTLAYTPAWARPAGTSDKTPPTNPADFATFAQTAAQRYAPRGVHVWEIWNEPNSPIFWEPRPDAAAYVQMLRAAYPAIHSADPGATVLTGGTAPAGGTLDYTSSDGWQSPWHFLKGVYDNGGRGLFDAVAHHPYAPQPYLPSTNAEWNSYQQTSNLHDLMVANGDGAKQIWGTEAGAWTGGSAAISETDEVQQVTEYLTLWGRWPWTGPFIYYEPRDKGTNPSDREQTFGLTHADWSPKPILQKFSDIVQGP